MSVAGALKDLLKSLLSRTPYRIARTEPNRFDATDSILLRLHRSGFEPGVVIDGGAHLGDFSLAARRLFPGAVFHLIEPQRACHPRLAAICTRTGFILHDCALADRVGTVEFMHTAEPQTGALVWSGGGVETVTVAASTLDALFGQTLARAHRPLLKMDLQGYELEALHGGATVLRSVEVILTEVSFYSQAHAARLLELMVFLDAQGFSLHDIVSLAGRARDNRLRQGDFLFVRRDSPLASDERWA
jgi:FkbM family methyltransferase